MPDPRFFRTLASASLEELAAVSGATLESVRLRGRVVNRVDSLVRAGPDAVSFLANRKYARDASSTRAGACLVAPGVVHNLPDDCAVLVSAFPQVAFASIANRLHQPIDHVDNGLQVHQSAVLESLVSFGPGVIVGPGASIGRNSFIGPGTVIGAGVSIGRDCHIGARASICFALIGNCVNINAGAVIGEAGFGATLGPKGIIDLPQLGRVIIQDGVTIGSGTCIDRGALGDTVIGENTKIDNLVQIAHNAIIGRNCVLAAHSGISGSVTIGDGCQFGGRAGVADHLNIGAGARIGAAAGVMHDVPSGESWGGFPARPVKRWLRETVVLAKMALRRTNWEDVS